MSAWQKSGIWLYDPEQVLKIFDEESSQEEEEESQEEAGPSLNLRQIATRYKGDKTIEHLTDTMRTLALEKALLEHRAQTAEARVAQLSKKKVKRKGIPLLEPGDDPNQAVFISPGKIDRFRARQAQEEAEEARKQQEKDEIRLQKEVERQRKQEEKERRKAEVAQRREER